jgi:hypothetical protein
VQELARLQKIFTAECAELAEQSDHFLCGLSVLGGERLSQ